MSVDNFNFPSSDLHHELQKRLNIVRRLNTVNEVLYIGV